MSNTKRAQRRRVGGGSQDHLRLVMNGVQACPRALPVVDCDENKKPVFLSHRCDLLERFTISWSLALTERAISDDAEWHLARSGRIGYYVESARQAP